MKYSDFKAEFVIQPENPKQRLGDLIYTVHAFTIWNELSKKQQESCHPINIHNAVCEYERLLSLNIPQSEALQSVLENFEV